jgi:hypothetical protein
VAYSPKASRKTPATTVSRAIETRKIRNPPSPKATARQARPPRADRRAGRGCGLDFVCMVRISDERTILALFKNASQQILRGCYVVAAALSCWDGGYRRVKVERVVLNALAEECGSAAQYMRLAIHCHRLRRSRSTCRGHACRCRRRAIDVATASVRLDITRRLQAYRGCCHGAVLPCR